MADYVHIFDTTLRDGEQSPGCSMNMQENLRVARTLDDLGHHDPVGGGLALVRGLEVRVRPQDMGDRELGIC